MTSPTVSAFCFHLSFSKPGVRSDPTVTLWVNLSGDSALLAFFVLLIANGNRCTVHAASQELRVTYCPMMGTITGFSVIDIFKPSVGRWPKCSAWNFNGRLMGAATVAAFIFYIQSMVFTRIPDETAKYFNFPKRGKFTWELKTATLVIFFVKPYLINLLSLINLAKCIIFDTELCRPLHQWEMLSFIF